MLPVEEASLEYADAYLIEPADDSSDDKCRSGKGKALAHRLVAGLLRPSDIACGVNLPAALGSAICGLSRSVSVSDVRIIWPDAGFVLSHRGIVPPWLAIVALSHTTPGMPRTGALPSVGALW